MAAFNDDGVEILELPGIDVPAGHIGAVFSDSLDVAQDASVGHRLRVGGGLNVGTDALVGGGLGVSDGIAAPNLGSGTGTPLVIDTSGNILEDSSSLRFKENVVPAELSSDAILRLEPKRYRHKGSTRESIGYLAEELDGLGLKDLVIYDNEGRPYSIAYDRIPLYQNETLKRQSETLETQSEVLERQQEEIRELRERLERLEGADRP